jgi:hypothetical protein
MQRSSIDRVAHGCSRGNFGTRNRRSRSITAYFEPDTSAA